MPKIMITFLGTGGGKTTTGRPTNDYRQTTYRWFDGTVTSLHPFFGLALGEKIKPDQILIIGTKDSMWSTILYHCSLQSKVTLDVDELFQLLDRNQGRPEIGQYLPELARALTALLQFQVSVRMIDFCLDSNEMVQLFAELVAFLRQQQQESSGDIEIILDITHSFRHIPLIAMTAITYITTILPRIRVGGLYYAIFEAKKNPQDPQEPTPIIDLYPAWEMIQYYHATRDFLNFGQGEDLAALLSRDYQTAAKSLQNVNNSLHLSMIKELSTNFNVLNSELAKVRKAAIPNSIVDLIIPEIQKMCTIAKREYEPWHSQINIAQWYYERKMFQQALTALVEGIITFILKYHGLDWDSREQRAKLSNTQADKLQREAIDDAEILTYIKRVKKLRNYINHASITHFNKSKSKEKKHQQPKQRTTVSIPVEELLKRIDEVFSVQCIKHLKEYFAARIKAKEQQVAQEPTTQIQTVS